MMDFCSRAYLLGTNPNTSFSQLVCVDVAVSILYHSIVYSFVAVILFYSMRLHCSCSVYLFSVFFVLFVLIMTLGYPARLARVKSILSASHNPQRTQSIVDNAYATWYFLG